MAKLQSDPEWVERDAARREQRAELAVAWARAEQPVLKRLAEVGIELRSLAAFSKLPASPEAMEILLEELRTSRDPRMRHAIGMALSRKESQRYWEPLFTAFVDENDEYARNGIANALIRAATATRVSDLLTLVHDERFESQRLVLLNALRRFKTGKEALSRLLGDPLLGPEARRLLGEQ